MAITEYQLSDRFLKDDGRVFLTGVQALARLPIEQMRIDKRNGLKTAAFVSGYPGSPLGGYDMELEKALRVATDVDVVLQPAVNEELGATAPTPRWRSFLLYASSRAPNDSAKSHFPRGS